MNHQDSNSCYVSSNIISVIIWIVGVLGNVINLLVFNQKEMSRSPVNLIFWWLSLSDLLELLTIVSYELNCDWCFMVDPSCIILDEFISTGDLIWASSYLLFAIHTFTTTLNIILAIMRFMAVRKPIHNRSSSNFEPIQRMVIGSFIFSFVSSLSILYKFTFLRKNNQYNTSEMEYFWMQLFETFIRLGSLLGLFISGTMLIFAVIKARNDRQRTLNSDQITKTGRKMNRINILTIVIISMFIVSDIVMIVDGVTMLRISVHAYYSENYEYKFCDWCLEKFKFEMMCFQLPTILVNCSYSIFCYLIFSSQYRETLRLYLSNRYNCILSKFRCENPEGIVEVQLETIEMQTSSF